MDKDQDKNAGGNGGDAAACGPSPGPGCSAVSVTVSDHPRGCLVCIDHDGQCLYLTAQEAQDLFDQLDDKLGQIPIGPIPSPHRYTAINHQQNPKVHLREPCERKVEPVVGLLNQEKT